MRKLLLLAVAGLALATAAPALAANPTTSGSATITDNVGTIVSNTAVPNTPADDGGAITFPIASGLTLAQITQLSADFNVTDDDCSAGSPRFAINFGTNKNVFVYLDPTPSVSGGCTANTWLSTGNLVGTSDACRVDTVADLARHAVHRDLGFRGRADGDAADPVDQLRRRQRLVAD